MNERFQPSFFFSFPNLGRFLDKEKKRLECRQTRWWPSYSIKAIVLVVAVELFCFFFFFMRTNPWTIKERRIKASCQVYRNSCGGYKHSHNSATRNELVVEKDSFSKPLNLFFLNVQSPHFFFLFKNIIHPERMDFLDFVFSLWLRSIPF